MRPNSGNAELGILLLVILAFAAADWLLHRFRRRKHGPVLSARSLRWYAYRRKAAATLAIPAAISCLLLASVHYGGMSRGAALASMAVVWALVFAGMLPFLRVQRRPVQHALKLFGEHLPDVRLSCAGASWVYSDADWLICVGGGSSAMAYAPEIDFSRPAQLRPYIVNASSTRGGSIHINTKVIVLFLHDGGECMLHMAWEGLFLEWLHRHGGRLDFEKPRHKYDRKAKNR